jgi:hypothetical protein
MEESEDLKRRQEDLMKSIKSVFLQMAVFDGCMAVVLVIVPIYLMGIEAFHDGMPLTLVPFFIVMGISWFVYFKPKCDSWKNI